MGMKTLIVGLAATALFVTMSSEAEAVIKKASKQTTIKSGKLVSTKTGRVLKGYVQYKSKVYYNGKSFTGVKAGIYYVCSRRRPHQGAK